MTHGMRLTELLHPDLVLPDVGTLRKEELLDLVAARLAAHYPSIDRHRLTIALLKRERLMSTALADGVAIPHARLGQIPKMVAAFGRSPAGIDWGSQDGLLTHVFLVLVAPDDANGSHLKVLANAARLLRDAGCRQRIMGAADETSLLDVLRAEEARVYGPTPTIALAPAL
jgi:mannitol/fructose-specific phosphotransferase system IIA component (Ntr-type)